MWALAWRNIWRKRWRSLVTIGAVALVVILTLVYFGIGGAARNALYQSLTESSGHLQVRVEGYRDLREFSDLLIRNPGDVRAALEAFTDNAWIVEVLEAPGLIEGSVRSRGLAFQGVARPDALQARYADETLIEGRLPARDELDGVALSRGLARAIGVGTGDTVYLYAPGTEGYGAAAYTVVGILDMPGAAHLAQLSLPAAQELAAPDAVTRMEVHLPDFRRASDDEALPALQQRLQGALGGYTIETWRDVNPGLAAYIELLAPMQAVATGIFFILAGLLVTNTVYLSVIERVREFGVIQALGASKRKVVGMVLSESLFLCFLGALIGSAVAAMIVRRMAQGFSFPAELGEYLADLGLPPVLYASVSPGQLAVAVAFTFAMGVLAAVLPALTATRLEPVEAMRFTA
jgi:ABC-type lipoprotein release transport system permease subunit